MDNDYSTLECSLGYGDDVAGKGKKWGDTLKRHHQLWKISDPGTEI